MVHAGKEFLPSRATRENSQTGAVRPVCSGLSLFDSSLSAQFWSFCTLSLADLRPFPLQVLHASSPNDSRSPPRMC